MSHRTQNGLLWRHLLDVQPSLQCGDKHATLVRPLREGLCSTVNSQAPVVAFVVALDFMRRPSAITRFVVAVIVDAIDRVARWALSHVGQKIDERVTPSVAHGNTTCAVVMVTVVAREVAAAFRSIPRVICSGWGSESSDIDAMTVRQLWPRARDLASLSLTFIARMAEPARIVRPLWMTRARLRHRAILPRLLNQQANVVGL